MASETFPRQPWECTQGLQEVAFGKASGAQAGFDLLAGERERVRHPSRLLEALVSCSLHEQRLGITNAIDHKLAAVVDVDRMTASRHT